MISILSFGTWSCGKDTHPQEEEIKEEENGREEEAPDHDGEVSERRTVETLPSTTAFAFSLLRGVSEKAGGEENIFISPLSASMALSMLSNGAAGQTRQEIQQALGYGELPVEEMNANLKDLSVFRPEHAGVVVEQANSLWAHKAIPVYPSYAGTLQSFYDAYVLNDHFTAAMINAWSAEKTHGRISQLLDPADPLGVLYIINTLYFKAKWNAPFNPAYTREEPFTDEAGNVSAAPAMNQTLLSHAFRGESYDMLELNYTGGAYSMVVLLPKDGVPLSSILRDLTPDAWREALSQMHLHDVSLTLPRFSIEYATVLNDVLEQDAGLQAISGPSADFSLITPAVVPEVFRIVQKSFAEINEEGTEAAAATFVEMFTSTGETYPSMTFHVNHPFLFFIHEKSTGLILFAGVIRSL
jgi:serpin B